ncbi:pre-B-cell leukemia homeobox interacting protein 1b isoform X2 [Scomber scombrus]|uniref:pre-B-cell leukemia homeobox interacting protein 1b isoform X2 n=1 Tax=Scomber scombrus TaxID=13677 RepID=UPI002DD8222A|nr:pre-B-cell leukemia homeobox interacting protein 1b isoform X2 [Scomber scombrus]
MSGSSSTNNSWTILTPEETAAETLRPLAEGTEHHEETHTSTAGSGANKQPAEDTAPAEGLSVEEHLVSEEKKGEPSEISSTNHHADVPITITDAPVPSSLEVSSSSFPGGDALIQSEGLAEGMAQSTPDPDSFSDSYTHISPSPEEPPASLLSTETLGGIEFTQEKERPAQERALHPLNGEELQREGEESGLSPRTTDLGKQADSPRESEVGDERAEKTGEEGEPEVRRRRSLLAALERIGRAEEEEEAEEEFQLPQRDEESGFSVNKCILGAIILVGLGTIFFSESDYNTRELKDPDVLGKQEWLNPEVPPPPADADGTDLLNKIADENQHISALHDQLQAQKEELKVAKGQAAEGAAERLQREEVEKENSRLKKEIASLPVLQKENERMKRELESVSSLQKELDTLRSTLTEIKLSSASEAAKMPVKPTASPPSGQPEDSKPVTAGSTERHPRKPLDEQRPDKKIDWKKDKHDMGEKKEWKEKEKSEWKEGEKKKSKDGGKTEWKQKEVKKAKHEQVKFDKEKEMEGKQKKHSDDKQRKEKDWKKEKASRGDEGKPWKDREGKKERTEKSERKELKGEKDWKKPKYEKQSEGKQWRGKEDNKDWKGGKEHGERHKGKEEWKGEKEWMKSKDGFKESGKDKWEKKDWKEKGERKEWKNKNGKDHGKEEKRKGERKQWETSENHGKGKGKNERKQWGESHGKTKNGKDDKDWKKTDEWKQLEKKKEEWKRGEQKEKKQYGEWKKDKSSFYKNKDEHKPTSNHHHHEEHLWSDKKHPHTHHHPSLDQPEYWVQQRDRLQHSPKLPQQCNSLETCAQAEGLLPVPLPEFEAILQTYLAKAEKAGVDSSKREELKKLATEFFKDEVFVHNQMSFQDFVQDVGDILEDMVDADEDSEEEDSAIEEEMEQFEREVMKKFSVPGAGGKEEKMKGEWKKESGRARG